MPNTASLTVPPQNAKRKPHQQPGQLPLHVWQAIRTLYLVQGQAPSEIATAYGLTSQRVRSLVCKEGWTHQRANKRQELATKLDAHAQESLGKVVEAVAVLSEQAAVSGLARAQEAAALPLHKDHAQAYRAYAGGARDLVNVARQARGLDSQQGQGAAGATFNLTQLVVQPREKPVEVVVDAAQVIDVTPAPLGAG